MPEVSCEGDGQQRRVTADVQGTAASFADLLLPPELVRSLHKAGFSQPSPVQQRAVPLGRFGADLIVQAKSGTGKTLTFGIIILEALNAALAAPQALVVEPTREVALQVQRTIAALCTELPLQCAAFVGGLPVHADTARLRGGACHVVVGTPGRLRALIQDGSLRKDHVRLLVFDEADTLLAGGFVDDIAFVYGALPARKQVLAFSATYTEVLLAQLRQLTTFPQEVMLCPETVTLHGVRQVYHELACGAAVLHAKEAALVRILGSLWFNQALVFCNSRGWAEALADRLCKRGFPAAFTCGSLLQRRRMEIIEAARAFRLRILISTDLNARGLDLPFVNLIINVDLPSNDATYLHRVGRTGRFGTTGIAVSLVTQAELLQLQAIVDRANGSLSRLPDEVPASWYTTDVPPEHSKALDVLRRVQPVSKRRAAPLHERPAAPDAAAVVSAEQPAADPSWAEWRARQEAYSYWWWRWAALSGGVGCALQPSGGRVT